MGNEDKKRKKSAIGYYSVVAFSLAVIGSVSWFAATKGTNVDKKNNNGSEYKQNNSSYNSSKTDEKSPANDQKTESAAVGVEDQPYTPQESTEKENISFVMPVEGTILKPYSSTDLQYSSTYADMRLHEGVDIKCAEGSVVRAAYKGTVTDILDDTLYGKVVVIDHGNGITVRYCGLTDIGVSKGQTVSAGEQIAFSGSVPCECADEPHIHIDAVVENKSVSIFDFFS